MALNTSENIKNGLSWYVSPSLVEYPYAVEWMEQHVNKMIKRQETEKIWLLEHPPLYTAGSSARNEELLKPEKLPVFVSNRGGRFTYHGPGQRVAYLMLDLNQRKAQDIRAFIFKIEAWIIDSLAVFNIQAYRHPKHIGIWVKKGNHHDKIAAIGIRLRRWVSFHGFSVNINPDLSHFQGILPCGINESNLGVTSMQALGVTINKDDFDEALKSCCPF